MRLLPFSHDEREEDEEEQELSHVTAIQLFPAVKAHLLKCVFSLLSAGGTVMSPNRASVAE